MLTDALSLRQADDRYGRCQTARAVSAPSSRLVRCIIKERELHGHEGCVNTVAFTPDGSQLLSGSDDRTVKIWDWTTGRQVLSWASGHTNNVFQARTIGIGMQHVVTCAADGQVRWHLLSNAGHVRSVLLGRHRGRAHKLAMDALSVHSFFSSGEDAIVRHYDIRRKTAGADKLVMVYSLKRSRERPVELNSIALNPRNPHEFAVGGDEEYCSVFDRRILRNARLKGLDLHRFAPEPVARYCPQHLTSAGRYPRVHITACTFSRYGELLVTYNDDDIYLFRPPELGSAATPAGRNGSSPAKRRRRGALQSLHGRSDGPVRRTAAHSSAQGGRAAAAASQRKEARRQRVLDAASPRTCAFVQSLVRVTDEMDRNDEAIGTAPRDSAESDGEDRVGSSAQHVAHQAHGASSGPEGPSADTFVVRGGHSDGVATEPHEGASSMVRTHSGDAPRQHEGRSDGMDGATPDSRGRSDSGPEDVDDWPHEPRSVWDIYVEQAAEAGDADERDDDEELNDWNYLLGDTGAVASGGSDDDASYEADADMEDDAMEAAMEAGDGSDSDPVPSGFLLRRGMQCARSQVPHALAADVPVKPSSSWLEPAQDCVAQRFWGHRNVQTVKGVNFLGHDDEYVVSGSDCGHLFIWSKVDGVLRNMQHGDDRVLNCLEPHPRLPLTLATSGIDDSVKIWSPHVPQRSRVWSQAEVMELEAVMNSNCVRPRGRTVWTSPSSMPQFFGYMMLPDLLAPQRDSLAAYFADAVDSAGGSEDE